MGSVDRVMLGADGHNYVPGPAGYDPEGLLGTLPAIAQGLIGVAMLLPYRAAVGVLPPAAASLLPILCYTALIWWAMAWLRRKKWIIKV